MLQRLSRMEAQTATNAERSMAWSWENPIVTMKFREELDDDTLVNIRRNPVTKSHHQVLGVKSLAQLPPNKTVDTVGANQEVDSMYTTVGQELPARFLLANVENTLLQEPHPAGHGMLEKQPVQDGPGINANRLIQHHFRPGTSRRNHRHTAYTTVRLSAGAQEWVMRKGLSCHAATAGFLPRTSMVKKQYGRAGSRQT